MASTLLINADRLPGGTYIRADESIYSPNGRFNATLQRDGNFVLYDNEAGQALWASDTGGERNPQSLAVQEDANLVLYKPGGEPYWATNTSGQASHNIELLMQDDGNLVLYGNGGDVLWASNTNQ